MRLSKPSGFLNLMPFLYLFLTIHPRNLSAVQLAHCLDHADEVILCRLFSNQSEFQPCTNLVLLWYSMSPTHFPAFSVRLFWQTIRRQHCLQSHKHTHTHTYTQTNKQVHLMFWYNELTKIGFLQHQLCYYTNWLIPDGAIRSGSFALVNLSLLLFSIHASINLLLFSHHSWPIQGVNSLSITNRVLLGCSLSQQESDLGQWNSWWNYSCWPDPP